MTRTHEPFLDTLQRVDWWAVVGLLIVAVSAILTGHILAAVGHFLWRQWVMA